MPHPSSEVTVLPQATLPDEGQLGVQQAAPVHSCPGGHDVPKSIPPQPSLATSPQASGPMGVGVQQASFGQHTSAVFVQVSVPQVSAATERGRKSSANNETTIAITRVLHPPIKRG